MYGCDCDGVQREPLDTGGVAGEAVRNTLKVIQSVAGHRPPSCPWRAFYEPIVRDVIDVAWAVPEGNLAAVVGTDSDHKLMQAVGIYRRALKATEAEESRCRAEDRERERRAREAARKASRG